MVMPRIKDIAATAAAGAGTEEGRRPTMVPAPAATSKPVTRANSSARSHNAGNGSARFLPPGVSTYTAGFAIGAGPRGQSGWIGFAPSTMLQP